MPVELGDDGAEVRTSGLQSNGREINGIEPNGIEPNGIEPNGIEPNGIEANGSRVQGTGEGAENNGPGTHAIEPHGVYGARTGRLRALRINGVRFEAGANGLRIDAIVVNGMKLEASGGLVIEEVEVEAPRPALVTASAPAPDFGAVTVSSIELPDGRSFET